MGVNVLVEALEIRKQVIEWGQHLGSGRRRLLLGHGTGHFLAGTTPVDLAIFAARIFGSIGKMRTSANRGRQAAPGERDPSEYALGGRPSCHSGYTNGIPPNIGLISNRYTRAIRESLTSGVLHCRKSPRSCRRSRA